MSESRDVAAEADPVAGGSPTLFFVLTYLLSWVLWAPLVGWLQAHGRLGVAGGGLEGLPVWIGVLWFLGSWSPSLVALGLTGRAGGWPAVKRLLRSAVRWRVGWRWNLLAWLGPLVLGLVALGLFTATGGLELRLDSGRWMLIPVALVAAVPFGPLGEELGWRGYALPRMLESGSALSCALWIGLAWTFWHLPLFWAPAGTTLSGEPVTWIAVLLYTVEVVALSILITWLVRGARGSVWIAIGAHAAWNAGMERFFFSPLPDAADPSVRFWSLVVLVAAALAVMPALRRSLDVPPRGA